MGKYELSWWEFLDGVWIKKQRVIDYIPETEEELNLELTKNAWLDDVQLTEIKEKKK